jgi:hypothetical protein
MSRNYFRAPCEKLERRNVSEGITMRRLLLLALLLLGCTSVRAQDAANRSAYATALSRALLSMGFDFQVMTPEKPTSKGENAKHYPRLIIFGVLNRPLVFQMAGEGEVLKNAKALGFNMVEFAGRSAFGGFDGRYFFELTGSELPAYDSSRRVCL